MASTYSPSLRLELMGTGDQSGTWGVTTNTNLGTLLEQAIAGFLSKAQGDVANLTLTASDGVSDEARNMVIDITGALTAGRNVVVPTSEKIYLFKNSTTGGFSITVKTAAGTGVAIVAGTSQWVYCDGTNVVQGLSGTMATQSAAAVAITGGTIAGLTTLTMASGAATPATNDAAALGTGALGWSDLALASGATINLANGNWIATHTSGILTIGTGDLRVTTAGTNAASVVTVGGTQTLTAKTLTAPALTSPVIGTTPTAAGATWTDLGTVTTADINGGTIDGAVIGGASAAAGTFTSVTAVGIRLSGTTAEISTNTSDASDTKALTLSGGGAYAADGSRGATILIGGNEYPSITGSVLVYAGNGVVTFGVAGVESARVTSAQLLVGATAGFSTTSGTVDGLNLTMAGQVIASNTSNTSGAWRRQGTDGAVHGFYKLTTNVGTITVTSSATAYNTSSDEDLKVFLGLYDPIKAIEIIRRDPVRDFNWIEEYGGGYAIGWGAQTSYGISKDLATQGHGKRGDEDYQPWGVDQGKRTPYLWAAMTNVLDRLEGLEEENKALRKRLDDAGI